MEVKIFTKIIKPKQSFWPSSPTSSDCGLETEINLWLASQPDIEIKNITQSQSGGSWMPATVIVTVWYKVK
ncbi:MULTISPECIES: hypothetical protein [Pseudoalteromonas]|jgi:hypothetical protein|uniref:hypothetical protein n=1 Tax=Pseudoalteromonas TaxID=53246 RepID=UPI0011096C43|nr:MULTISPECIES: hypothetical protein [Pseudoalteromonas]MCF2921968.1 hypothetical protein [Pseudoalteromonas sp. APAL1]TMO47567.1 hypothetical protein CWC25_00005 [Pseudoalteromonas sp. S4389]|tara:strand:- start:223 stop:435 length:213 start_codon:yes stop_codon:yes gene_type:complete